MRIFWWSEGSVPGPEGGYLVIVKAKKPPESAEDSPARLRSIREGGEESGEESLVPSTQYRVEQRERNGNY